MAESSDSNSNTTNTVQPDSRWGKFLEFFKDSVGQFQFQIFGQNLELVEQGEDYLKIAVPREFHREWIKEKQSEKFQHCIEEVYDKKTDVKVKVSNLSTKQKDQKYNNYGNETNGTEEVKFPFARTNDFHPDHTFETFVVGDSNEYAYSAARAISEDPVNSFNPLFIYGGVGLGKTHLLNAIGRKVDSTWDQANVKSINAEQFTNEIINAIREGNTKDFKYNYRNVDMFLVDDVQFLAKTDAAQEEFYHTFNALYEKGKGTAFCSDCPPGELTKIEERLRSRFGMGLTVDIQPPGYETRVAILQKKAEQENFSIPMNVIEFIAENLQGNVRLLERSLNRLVMKTSLIKQPPSVELARDELTDLFDLSGPDETEPLTVKAIQSMVAEHFNVSVRDLKSKKRTRSIAQPRQIAMYLARKETNHSYQYIGDLFGDRDHSTVIHAKDKIQALLENDSDSELARQVRQLKEGL